MSKVKGRNFLHRLRIAQENNTAEESLEPTVIQKSPTAISCDHDIDSTGKLGRITPQTEKIIPPNKGIKRYGSSLKEVCQTLIISK